MMDTGRWELELHNRYPNAKRILIAGPGEIIVELERGLAVAVIEWSKPHFHLWRYEHYKILEGGLAVIICGKVTELRAGRGSLHTVTINTCEVHQAVTLCNKPAIVEIKSNPPWSPDDHFVVKS
jgi:mannose-6-phosphate isomerase-like protein (cupin superfamily)